MVFGKVWRPVDEQLSLELDGEKLTKQGRSDFFASRRKAVFDTDRLLRSAVRARMSRTRREPPGVARRTRSA